LLSAKVGGVVKEKRIFNYAHSPRVVIHADPYDWAGVGIRNGFGIFGRFVNISIDR